MASRPACCQSHRSTRSVRGGFALLALTIGSGLAAAVLPAWDALPSSDQANSHFGYSVVADAGATVVYLPEPGPLAWLSELGRATALDRRRHGRMVS